MVGDCTILRTICKCNGGPVENCFLRRFRGESSSRNAQYSWILQEKLWFQTQKSKLGLCKKGLYKLLVLVVELKINLIIYSRDKKCLKTEIILFKRPISSPRKTLKRWTQKLLTYRSGSNHVYFYEIKINLSIVKSFFKALKLPDVPNSYYHNGKAPKSLPSPEDAINAHGTMTKIKRAITPRYTFIKEGTYEFHNPQSTSFLQYGWINTKKL